MRIYNEYLIPETIDHEELKYLVSIGSKVLVKIEHPNLVSTIVELFPSRFRVNYNIYPLSDSDIYFLERNMVNIHFKLYYIG